MVIYCGIVVCPVCETSILTRPPPSPAPLHPPPHHRLRTIAGAAVAHLINSSPINPEHLVSANSQPTHLVAYKETREGLYGPYEVEVEERPAEV